MENMDKNEWSHQNFEVLHLENFNDEYIKGDNLLSAIISMLSMIRKIIDADIDRLAG